MSQTIIKKNVKAKLGNDVDQKLFQKKISIKKKKTIKILKYF